MTPVAPTVSSVRFRFPEFSVFTDAQIAFAIEEAQVSIGQWSTNSGAKIIAWYYLAAHILAVNIISTEANGRDIRHEAIGRITVSYKSDLNVNSPEWGDLSTTTYGRRYLRMQQFRTSNKPFGMVGGRPESGHRWGWQGFWW